MAILKSTTINGNLTVNGVLTTSNGVSVNTGTINIGETGNGTLTLLNDASFSSKLTVSDELTIDSGSIAILIVNGTANINTLKCIGTDTAVEISSDFTATKLSAGTVDVKSGTLIVDGSTTTDNIELGTLIVNSDIKVDTIIASKSITFTNDYATIDTKDLTVENGKLNVTGNATVSGELSADDDSYNVNVTGTLTSESLSADNIVTKELSADSLSVMNMATFTGGLDLSNSTLTVKNEFSCDSLNLNSLSITGDATVSSLSLPNSALSLESLSTKNIETTNLAVTGDITVNNGFLTIGDTDTESTICMTYKENSLVISSNNDITQYIVGHYDNNSDKPTANGIYIGDNIKDTSTDSTTYKIAIGHDATVSDDILINIYAGSNAYIKVSKDGKLSTPGTIWVVSGSFQVGTYYTCYVSNLISDINPSRYDSIIEYLRDYFSENTSVRLSGIRFDSANTPEYCIITGSRSSINVYKESSSSSQSAGSPYSFGYYKLI